MLFTLCYVVAVSGLLFLLRAPLAAVFSATGVAKDLLFLFCGPLALFWFFNGAIYVGNASCNNLKHPFVSTVVNWGRNTLGIVPTVRHADYIGSWLDVMREDSRAIVRAAPRHEALGRSVILTSLDEHIHLDILPAEVTRRGPSAT